MSDETPPVSAEDAMLAQLLALIPTLTNDKLVKLFIKTRASKSTAKKAFDEQDERFDRIMKACTNFMLKHAQADGVTGFKTDFGTTYTAVDTKISIADESAFFDFVKAQGDLDFFERRVSSRHVEDYMKANAGNAPPGLNIFRENVMRVRKVAEKPE